MPAPAFSRDCAVAPSIRRRQRALAHAQPFPSSRHDYHSSTEARIRQVRPPTGSIAHTDRQQRSDDRPGRARVRDGSGRAERQAGRAGALPRCANNRCGAAARPALDLCNRCRAAIRRTAARPPLGLLHRCAQLVHHESASVSPRMRATRTSRDDQRAGPQARRLRGQIPAARGPSSALRRARPHRKLAQLVHHESASVSTRNSPSIPMLRMGPLAGHPRHYIRSIIALPNPEQLTCVEPGIRRAKS